jgi:shikimate kinase|uniref:shikimate kinase n=1 Tax=Candidatus Planktophila sp. TaxID=2175601 RepID=UPI00404941DD
MPRLILIGPPGCGKSTVGAAIANKLSIEFIDTDSAIEISYGHKISDIFVDKGEDFFRDLEFTALTQSLSVKDCVLSLGGGAPIASRAQNLLKSSQTPVFFLDVSLAVAAPRVGFNRDRPLLLGNPRAQWQSLAETRRPIYESLASYVIKVDAMSVKEVVDAIEAKL